MISIKVTSKNKKLTTHRRTTMKAVRENGLWVITAIVGGSVEEFAGKRLGDAIALLKRAQERAA